jgi:hypothetical protein
MSRDLAQLLTEDGERWRAVQPRVPRLDDMVADVQRPRPRRWMPLLAAACVLLVVTAVAVPALLNRPAGHGSAPQTAPNPVPWPSTLKPATSTAAEQPDYATWTQAPSGTPSCNDASFAGQVVTSGPPGRVAMRIALTLTSDQACWVSTFGAYFVLRDQHGDVLGSGQNAELIGHRFVRAIVRPGQVVLTEAWWGNWCGTRSATPASLEIHLSGTHDAINPSLVLPVHATTGAPACSPLDGGGNWITGDFPSIVNQGSLQTLWIGVIAPHQATRGTTLRYTVSVTNPTVTDVVLSPCPSFTQRLAPLGILARLNKAVSTSAQLNCAQSPGRVAAHTTVNFTMQQSTHDTAAGTWQLTWSWLGHTLSAGEFAAMPLITITN